MCTDHIFCTAHLLYCHTEQSKFLGGDVAHTHLVKGLDYALLNQQRQKLKTGSSEPGGAAAAAAAAAVAEATAAAQKQSMKFATPLGRSLYQAVFRPAAARRTVVREMFQPKRTAFVFEFGEGAGDVPTTLRRSKADCPVVQVSMCRGEVLEVARVTV
jgi:IK cytokine